MAPFFTFFVDKKDSGRCAPYIKKLDEYYPSFADGVYISPPDMKKRYQGSNAKFFAMDFQDLIMFDLDTVSEIEPLMAVTMDSFTKMNNDKWCVIYKFLKAVFEEEYINLEDIHKLIPPVPTPAEKIQLLKSKEIPKDQNKEYGFAYSVENNIAYCQVMKPYTDLPYTVVIRDFDTVGFEPLFTALYAASSWGVCNHDHVFLTKLWAYLNMYGDLDLENRLAAEIKKCQEGKPEPEVYRLDISGVKEQLSLKHKRRNVIDVDPSKFIRI
jgi:hypothetical protein